MNMWGCVLHLVFIHLSLALTCLLICIYSHLSAFGHIHIRFKCKKSKWCGITLYYTVIAQGINHLCDLDQNHSPLLMLLPCTTATSEIVCCGCVSLEYPSTICCYKIMVKMTFNQAGQKWEEFTLSNNSVQFLSHLFLKHFTTCCNFMNTTALPVLSKLLMKNPAPFKMATRPTVSLLMLMLHNRC